jgi:hypothetical protein
VLQKCELCRPTWQLSCSEADVAHFRTPFTSCFTLTTTVLSPVLQVCQPFSPGFFLPEEYTTSLKRKRRNKLKYLPSAWYFPHPLHGAKSPVGQGLPIIEVSQSHSDTRHSVGLLWTRDQPDAETSTWQNNTHNRQTGRIRTSNLATADRAVPFWDSEMLYCELTSGTAHF